MTVVLLAHGSPDPRHGTAVHSQALALRAVGLETHVAYLDHQPPTLAQTFAQIPPSATPVTVIPLLISQAFHAQVDVPNEVAQLDRDVRVVSGWLTDEVLLSALDVVAPVDMTADDALILVTAGSSNASALAADHDRSAAWAQRRGVAAYAPAFASGPGQRTSAAIESFRAAGVRRIHVVAAFLAPGVLLDRVMEDSQSLTTEDSLTAAPLLGNEHVTAALHAAASA